MDFIKGRYAIHCRRLHTMATEREACGKELFRPLPGLDNALVLVGDGLIEDIVVSGPYRGSGYKRIDTNGATVIPAVVNAHCHLQLSWTGGQIEFPLDFSSWLKQLVELMFTRLRNGKTLPNPDTAIYANVFKQLAAYGTGLIGDVGGSLPGALGAINSLAPKHGLDIVNFCEWLGFTRLRTDSPWPERCRSEIEAGASWVAKCAPAGHALYSTSEEIMRKAKKACQKMGRVFSFHLAESEQETEMLMEGKGELHDFYRPLLLPENWQPPGMTPFALAQKFALLDKDTLAVHGVHLAKKEICSFVSTGAALCLCPRSNANLKSGNAPVKALIDAGARLCMGTDGLSSNTDLDVRREALYLREKHDLPLRCLIRMLTVNGTSALHAGQERGRLFRGQKARLCALPPR